MSLANRFKKDGNRPAGFTCEKYQAQPDNQRCMHYGEGGSCTLPGQGKCAEWLKVNPVKDSAGPETLRLTPPPVKPAAPILEPTPPADPPAEPEREGTNPEPDGPDEELPLPRVTEKDIAEFRALNLEVCLSTKHVGEIWLVPEYTGKDRKELRADHAATLFALCSTFPGAKITSFISAPKPGNSEARTELCAVSIGDNVPFEKDDGSIDV